VSGNSNLDLAGAAGNITVNKNITLNGGNLINSSANTTILDNGIAYLTLTANPTVAYTGPSVSFTPNDATGSGVSGTAGNGVAPGGSAFYVELTTPGSGYTVAPTVNITDSGAGAGATATATISSVALIGTSNTIGGNGNIQVNDVISGAAAGFSKVGSDTLTLTGVNTYSGATTVSAGVLQLGDGTAGHDGTIANSASVVDNASLVYDRFGSASYGGVISGGGSVSVIGTGSQTLSGNNTYNGATSVGNGSAGNGTLFVTGTLADTTGVTVNAGARLGGSGVVTNISGQGEVAPADGPNILTATSINPGTNMSFAFQFTQLTPTYTSATGSGNDVLHLTSPTAPFTLTLASTNVITIDFSAITGSLAMGQQYEGGFFVDDSSVTSVGTPTFNYTGAGSWTIEYEGLVPVTEADFATGTVLNGNVMEFEVIPEPSTYAMIFSGFGMLFGFQKVRRRRRASR
jgi:autotransporter-associated beta strand protein